MSKNQEERKPSPSVRTKIPNTGRGVPDREPSETNRDTETGSAAAADLRSQNALLRAILESTPGDLFAFDDQGMLLHAPDAWLAGGWYVPGETHLTDMIHLDEKQDAWARFREVLKDSTPRRLELRLLQPDGNCRWSKLEFHPYTSGGKVVQITAFSVDTQADRAQDTVRQLEEERFSLARRAAQIGIWDWDESAKRLFWDERTIELFGLQPDEFTGTFESWTRAIHPEDLVRSEAEFLEALRGASTYDTEFRILLPQGGVRHIKSYGKIVRDETGRTVRMTGINIDITDLKQSEIRYRNFGRLYATLSQVNQTIVREKKRVDLFEKICQVAVEYGEFRLAWIGIFGEVEESITPVASAARFGNPLPFGEIRIREHPFSNGLIGRACASGEVCYSNDIFNDPDMQHWRPGAAEGGYRSAAAIPIFEDGALAAVFSLFAAEPDFFIIEEEQTLLTEMGLDISFALDNILREERRLRALEDLRRSEESLRNSQRVAQVGHWTWELRSNRVTWSEEMRRIFDVDPQEFDGDLDSIIAQCIHPEDRERVLQVNRDVLDAERPTALEYRIIRRDGGVRTIWAQPGEKVFGSDGEMTALTGIVQDISERKAAEEALRLAKEKAEENERCLAMLSSRLNEAQRCAGIGSWEWDLLANEMWWSDQLYAIFEVSPEDYHPDLDRNAGFIHPEDNGPFHLELGRIIEARERLDYDVRILTPTGKVKYCNARGYVVTDQAGNPIRVNGTLLDISDRRSNEEALRLSEEKYRRLAEELEQRVRERTAQVQDLYDNAPCGYHSLDAGGNFVMVNQTELNWLGYTREEMLGLPDEAEDPRPPMHIRDVLTEDGQRQFAERFPVFLAQGWIRDLEYDFVRKDGSILPVVLNAIAIYDEKGEITSNRVTVFDNTERKRAQQALRDSEARFNFLLKRTPAVIFTTAVGLTSPITYVSESIRSVLGYDPSAFTDAGDFYVTVIHPDDFPILDTARQMLAAKDNHVAEVRMRTAGGAYLWMSVGMSVIRDEQGEPQEVVGYCVDIDALKNAQEALRAGEEELRRSRDELRLANAALERASHMKDEFLASMSHELRTPLTSILGLAESLQLNSYGEMNEKQNGALRNIEESGRHLLALINDILDLSKIEAGRLDVQMQPCSLGEVCRASLLMTRGTANKKRQTVSFTMTPEAIGIVADVRRLKQMLVNLLGNAVKFTGAGGSLGLDVVGDAGKGEVRLTVWDTGIGIPAEAMERLFQPFVQLDSRLSREHEGTGLGLTLVQRMAELHGGSLHVQSAPGMGSRFTVVLPWQEPPKADESAARGTTPAAEDIETGGAQLEVLLVDDNETIIAMIRDYLAGRGVVVHTAHSGPQMLSLLREIRPDVILLDIQMPGMDGLEAARRLRALPDAAAAATPVIAATALAMPGDEERCLEAGVDLYLTKPLHLAELLRTMIRLAEKARPPEADTPSGQPA